MAVTAAAVAAAARATASTHAAESEGVGPTLPAAGSGRGSAAAAAAAYRGVPISRGQCNAVGEEGDVRLLPAVRRYCLGLESRLGDLGLPPAIAAAPHVLLPTMVLANYGKPTMGNSNHAAPAAPPPAPTTTVAALLAGPTALISAVDDDTAAARPAAAIVAVDSASPAAVSALSPPPPHPASSSSSTSPAAALLPAPPALPTLAQLMLPSPCVCILCDAAEVSVGRRNRGTGLHPLVPVAEGGLPVPLCPRCHHSVLERRRRAADSGRLHGKDGAEDLCALCGAGAATHPGLDVVCCSAAECPRSYCSKCTRRLLSADGLAALVDLAEWLCPPCAAVSAPLIAAAMAAEGAAAAAAATASPAPAAPTRPSPEKEAKRARQDVASSIPPSSSASGLALATTEVAAAEAPRDEVWWFASYVREVAQRAAASKAAAASLTNGDGPSEMATENFCFHCKDGGDLIECDYVHTATTATRCPKVRGNTLRVVASMSS